MTLHAKDVARKIKNLASLPDVCIKINQIADQPNTSTQDLKSVIETDPALSAKLLQRANTSFYGNARQVDDLNRAIMLIGTQALRDLVWGMTSVTTFSKLTNSLVDMQTFWEHALYTATVARVLAKKCHVINQERLFLSGLLHDIGQLALYQIMPAEMEVVFLRVKSSQEHLILAEKNVLGFTHPTVSFALLKMWNIPDSVCQSAAYHHQPRKCKSNCLEASIVHIADNISNLANKSGHSIEKQWKIESNAWKITGLTEKIIDSVIQISDEQFKDAAALYLNDLLLAPAA